MSGLGYRLPPSRLRTVMRKRVLYWYDGAWWWLVTRTR